MAIIFKEAKFRVVWLSLVVVGFLMAFLAKVFWSDSTNLSKVETRAKKYYFIKLQNQLFQLHKQIIPLGLVAMLLAMLTLAAVLTMVARMRGVIKEGKFVS